MLRMLLPKMKTNASTPDEKLSHTCCTLTCKAGQRKWSRIFSDGCYIQPYVLAQRPTWKTVR